MNRRLIFGFSAASLVALAAVAWSTPEPPVGAPFVSVEMPANPLNRETRGAALLVRAYYHQNAAGFPVVGVAEGLVNGERQTIDLEFERTSMPGVYALDQQWPSKGDWMLMINVEGANQVGVVVELGPDGGVRGGGLFGNSAKIVSARSIRSVGEKASAGEVDRTLRSLAASSP